MSVQGRNGRVRARTITDRCIREGLAAPLGLSGPGRRGTVANCAEPRPAREAGQVRGMDRAPGRSKVSGLPQT